MRKIFTKSLITQNTLFFGLWLWNKLRTFISWLWHCTEHKRCKVFTFFENSTFLIFFHYYQYTICQKHLWKNNYFLKIGNLGIHGFCRNLLAAKHPTVCIQCEFKIFFEVIRVSQGFHNLVLNYKLVIFNIISLSRHVGYSPIAHERSYWQRNNHL